MGGWMSGCVLDEWVNEPLGSPTVCSTYVNCGVTEDSVGHTVASSVPLAHGSGVRQLLEGGPHSGCPRTQPVSAAGPREGQGGTVPAWADAPGHRVLSRQWKKSEAAAAAAAQPPHPRSQQ